MAKRVHGDLIVEYQFLKKKVKKMVLKAEGSGPVQQKRLTKKIANIMRQMLIIESDCKAMDLPHPDSFDPDYEEPSLAQMQEMNFSGPQTRSVVGPDGCLYGKEKVTDLDSQVTDKIRAKLNPDGCLSGKDMVCVDSQVADKLLVKLNPDGTLYDKNGILKNTEGQIQKMIAKSNPDGSLFETPALEGSILPRRAEDN